MLFLSRWTYYLSSIPTLLLGFRPLSTLLAAFLRWPLPRPFKVELRSGLAFYVRGAMDIWIMKETCLDRDYEVYGHPLQDGWVILDIGAALGDFALWAGYHNPSSRVYAIEPAPDSFALLQQNQILNGINNVQTYPYAVGKLDGELWLNLEAGEGVMFSTSQPAQDETQRMKVQALSLERLLEELALTQCDFLKMDCEGGEYDILLGASAATLQKIQRLCLEYHDHLTAHTHPELVAHLERHGFRVRVTPNRAHREIGFLYAER
jgi:FkbM family methyltransferase